MPFKTPVAVSAFVFMFANQTVTVSFNIGKTFINPPKVVKAPPTINSVPIKAVKPAAKLITAFVINGCSTNKSVIQFLIFATALITRV